MQQQRLYHCSFVLLPQITPESRLLASLHRCSCSDIPGCQIGSGARCSRTWSRRVLAEARRGPFRHASHESAKPSCRGHNQRVREAAESEHQRRPSRRLEIEPAVTDGKRITPGRQAVGGTTYTRRLVAYVVARIVPASSGKRFSEFRINGCAREASMLFCFTADYTPQALNAMRETPTLTGERHWNSCLKPPEGSSSPCTAGPLMVLVRW